MLLESTPASFTLDNISQAPRSTGVYAIHCTVNDFLYIGSTAALGFKTRFRKHRVELRRKRHHSAILQRHFNKHGSNAFTFHILEECASSDCLEREQAWLDIRGIGYRNKSYNTLSVAGSPLGLKHSAGVLRKMSDLAIASFGKEYIVTTPSGEEICIKGLARFCRENGLNEKNMSRLASGKGWKHKGYQCRHATETREAHEARIVSLGRDYIVTAPNEQIYQTNNLKQFCRDYGLNFSGMCGVLTARKRAYNGWKVVKVNESEAVTCDRSNLDREYQSRIQNQKFIVTLPDTTELVVNSLPAFCKEHNLTCKVMYKVAKGIGLLTYKGYQCRFVDESEDVRLRRLARSQPRKPRGKLYLINSPTGETFRVRSLVEFCQERGLDTSAMTKVAKGKQSNHKGYKCQYIE